MRAANTTRGSQRRESMPVAFQGLWPGVAALIVGALSGYEFYSSPNQA